MRGAAVRMSIVAAAATMLGIGTFAMLQEVYRLDGYLCLAGALLVAAVFGAALSMVEKQ